VLYDVVRTKFPILLIIRNKAYFVRKTYVRRILLPDVTHLFFVLWCKRCLSKIPNCSLLFISKKIIKKLQHHIIMTEEAKQNTSSETAKPVVNIKNLNFSYDKGTPNIVGLDCVIQPNSKVILVGANGAGKSTLLRILTGQIFMNLESDEFDINGTATPNDQCNGVAYLGGVWKRRRTGFDGICPYTMDIAARDMMAKWQEEHLERRDELVRALGINLDWRMHECSDGQRKKVRIMIKLLRPFQLCIIDEFAADLDIFSRTRFFNYLSSECEKRGASVVYATHIFDNADAWGTHVVFMQLDRQMSPIHCLETHAPYQEILARTGANRAMCPMYVLVLEELERQYRSHPDFAKLINVDDIDNQCLADVIIDSQAREEGGSRHDNNGDKDGDQSGWVSGRLARELAMKSMDEEKQKWFEAETEKLLKKQKMAENGN
jgi:CCR4-NOT complex subunit CAF16